jgi:uncharacterized membrane-anchored protein
MTTLRKHALAALTLAALALPAAAAEPDAPELDWTPGPGKMEVGGSLADVDLPEGMVFLDKKNTRKFLEATGNIPRDTASSPRCRPPRTRRPGSSCSSGIPSAT